MRKVKWYVTVTHKNLQTETLTTWAVDLEEALKNIRSKIPITSDIISGQDFE